MLLGWSKSANLEQSLFDFLTTTIQNEDLKVLNESGEQIVPQVRIGRKADADWQLPCIQIYHDSNPTAPFLSIGSTRRDRRYLVILDIRANNETNRMNLADWLATTIESGFHYFEYTMNGNSPTKEQKGYVDFDFVSDLKVPTDDSALPVDKYRHRISISCWIYKN